MDNQLKQGKNSSSSFKKWGIFILYSLFLISSSIYSYKKPLYNWDMLAYMALIVDGGNHNTAATTHDLVYNSARQQMPAQAYAMLADTTHPFKKKMLTDPVAFNKTLAFYTVKPLYMGLGYLSYKAGIPLTKATVLPSVISYFLIGTLLFFWLIKYIDIFLAFLCSACILCTAPMFNAAKLSTPDCLSAFLFFMAMYFLLERQRLWPTFFFLLLSVFARIDNIIACFLITSLLCITDKWAVKITKGQYALMLAAMVVCYFSISYSGVKYGWDILFYPSFVQRLDTHSGLNDHFSIIEYARLAYSQVREALYFSHIVVYMVMLLLVFVSNKRNRSTLNFDQLLGIMIISIIAIRFALLPEIDDRFYVGMYLTITLLLIRSLSFNKASADI